MPDADHGGRTMTHATAGDVIAGREPWSLDCNDALAWLRGLPAGCVDAVVITDPPYGDCIPKQEA